uniref:Uncharacterized protein n=1 Tax=Ciona savignyi TaxID=51511 RepID=H2YFS6_CIOSA
MQIEGNTFDPQAGRADDSSDDFVVLSPLVGAEQPKTSESSSPFTVYSNAASSSGPYMMPQTSFSHGELKSEQSTPSHSYGGYMNVNDQSNHPHYHQLPPNMDLVTSEHLHRDHIPGHYDEMLHSQGSMNSTYILRGGGGDYAPIVLSDDPGAVGTSPNVIIPDVMNEEVVTSDDPAPPTISTNQMNNIDVPYETDQDTGHGESLGNQLQQLNIDSDTDETSTNDLNQLGTFPLGASPIDPTNQHQENEIEAIQPNIESEPHPELQGRRGSKDHENLVEPEETIPTDGVYVAAGSTMQPEPDNPPTPANHIHHVRTRSTGSTGSQKSIEVLKQPI